MPSGPCQPSTRLVITNRLRYWSQALLLACLGGGCSIPVWPSRGNLTVGYVRTSLDERQVQTKVPGMDVRIGTSYDGVTVGWSSVLAASVASVQLTSTTASLDTGKRLRSFVPPLGFIWTDDTATHRLGWFFWYRPKTSSVPCHFVASSYGGFTVNGSPYSKGVEFGFGRQTWLVAPIDSDGAWRLDFRDSPGRMARLEQIHITTNQIHTENEKKPH